MAVKHQMVGLLVFEDVDLSAHGGHKRCSSHPPRAIIEMDHYSADPLSPGFPASGCQFIVVISRDGDKQK